MPEFQFDLDVNGVFLTVVSYLLLCWVLTQLAQYSKTCYLHTFSTTYLLFHFIECQFLNLKLFESPLCTKSVFINNVALPCLGQWAKTVTVSQQSAMLLNFIKRADKVQPHEVKLIHCKIPYRKIYFRQSFFSDRAAHTWNSIPTELRNITSLKSF